MTIHKPTRLLTPLEKEISPDELGLTVRAALAYARRGLAVLPLFPVDYQGQCVCPLGEACRHPGKHPIHTVVKRGHLDATTDPALIEEMWWSENPFANVGIALAASGLVVVAPDSEQWHEIFRQRGLPETFTVRSGGGPGHFHYYYRRPPECPTTRVCRSGEYDILSDGLVVAPPSNHASGYRYSIAHDPGWSHVTDLPTAPSWVVEELECRDRQGTPLLSPPKFGSDVDGVSVYQRVRPNLPEQVRILIEEGPPVGADRSHCDAVVVTALLGEGLSDSEIAAVFRSFPIGTEGKYAERGDQYLSLTISKVRSYRAAHAILRGNAPDPRAMEPSAMTALAPSQVPLSTTEVTERGIVEGLVAAHGTKIRFVRHPKMWMVWDGKRWVEDTALTEVRRLVTETIRDAQHWIIQNFSGEGQPDQRRRLLRATMRMENARSVRGILEMAETIPDVAIRYEDFDANPWLVNVHNGTVDLRTGTLYPHRREDYLTQITTVPYEPDATAPQWQEFLNTIFDHDEALIGYVQRVVGYALTGDTSERAFFLAYGPGRNGKSLFLEVLAAVLGDIAAAVNPEALLQQRSALHPTDLAMLRGKRFVYAQEPPEGRRLNVALVKALTGGDTITARRMREDPWQFKPTFKLWMATNSKPIIGENGPAIWDRIKLIPFTVTIPKEREERREVLLDRFVRQEGSGVLRWAVEGCLAYLREGLNEPSVVLDAVKEYREEMDVLGQFLSDCREVAPDNPEYQVRLENLYRVYSNWCHQNGETPWDTLVLGRKLTERGFPSKTVRVQGKPTKVRIGIRLREPFRDPWLY